MIKLRGLDSPDPNWSRLNQILGRLADKDAGIWGEAAAVEAAIRLDWIDLPETSRALLPELDALVAWSKEQGHSEFVLCGMGGSSLAPEVIASAFGKTLTVLDSTDPHQVGRVIGRDLGKCCIIIASKSGSTIETISQQSALEAALTSQGYDPAKHLVVITDPGSPLEARSKELGYRIIIANPKVGGRFSALSAFGLTPAALIGVDVSTLLDDASTAAREFTCENSVVVRMAALLAQPERRFTSFFDADSEFPGISDWIEQLVAESTGKNGRGVLPVVVERATDESIQFTESGPLSVLGPLGAQFIFWEWVTALLCYLLEVDPFNQPNVAESKERTGKILVARSGELEVPKFSTSNLAIFGNNSESDAKECIRNTFKSDYIALMAYLDREQDHAIRELRALLASKSGRPTTFGWGPRFLHSTGQFHKGGPLVGAFIQITGAAEEDIEIPSAGFGFATLIAAQAQGDREALAARDLPVLRIHLNQRAAGIRELLDLVSSL